MRKTLLKCPKCDVALLESKPSPIFLAPVRASGKRWMRFGPLEIDFAVHSLFCPGCGLVVLSKNEDRNHHKLVQVQRRSP